MQDTRWSVGCSASSALLVLGAALYVVKRGPWLTRFAVMLALPVVVLSIWLAFDFDLRGQAIVAALVGHVLLLRNGSLIAYMLEDEFASADELFACRSDVHAASLGIRLRVPGVSVPAAG
jgi:hypothetical protein